MRNKTLNKIGIFIVVCLLFITVLPKVLNNDYLITVAATAMVYSIVVYGLSVLLGMGGMVKKTT